MKTIKTFLLILILLVSFIIGANARTVYVSENGKKFHKKNCATTNPGKKGLDVKEAKKLGYEPCKVCKPDEAIEDKNKKGASKSGAK